jgi:hypothetical protein
MKDGTESEGRGLPVPETAQRIWALVQPALAVGLADIEAGRRGLSAAVRADVGLRAQQALVVALDVALLAGRSTRRDASGSLRAGRPLTANVFVEALAARWSERYWDVRDKTGSGSLWNMTPETVVAIREELLRRAIDVRRLWVVVRDGVPGLYSTTLSHRLGRTVTVDEDSPLFKRFNEILAADPSYRRPIRGPRLLLADDPMPSRKIAQFVAGEHPFDVMTVGPATETALQRLEAARVFLHVPSVHDESVALKRQLADSAWPKALRAWEDGPDHAEMRRRQNRIKVPVLERKPTLAKRKARKAAQSRRDAIRTQAWKAFLTPANAKLRNEYRALKGDALAMAALAEQVVRSRVVEQTDPDGWVEIKCGFYKHATRRFQARHAWPAEITGRDVRREVLGYHYGGDHGDIEEARIASRRGRWFRVAASVGPEERWRRYRALERQWPEADLDDPRLDDVQDLVEYDISGSQPQILAVLMGLREVEHGLSKTSFKTLVAKEALKLHEDAGSAFRLPGEMVDQDRLTNAVKDATMTRLYGSKPAQVVRNLQRDPDRYGFGLGDKRNVEALLTDVPMIRQLLEFLPVAEAVGLAAYAVDPTAGVEVVDPLDKTPFRWNPLRRQKIQVASGSFKLYVGAPVLSGDGYLVYKKKLIRRIAPGLIHMLDSFFAALVLERLHTHDVRDVVMIHDAWLVPLDAEKRLTSAISSAGEPWLRGLGPIYDVFDRYLTGRFAAVAREWRHRWEKRIADCTAGRDQWPLFLVKREVAKEDYRLV